MQGETNLHTEEQHKCGLCTYRREDKVRCHGHRHDDGHGHSVTIKVTQGKALAPHDVWYCCAREKEDGHSTYHATT